MNALFLVEEGEGGLSPAARFRVHQLVPHLERLGISCEVVPSRPPKYWLERQPARRLKRHPRLQLAGLAALSAAMAVQRWPWIQRAAQYDVVILQRDLLPLGTLKPFLELALVRRNPRVVFDFDDAIFATGSTGLRDHGSRHGLRDADKIGHIVSASRHVIAGNDVLATWARRWNSQVTVVPTVIDTDVYKVRRWTDSGDSITIGWSGTHGNLHYLAKLSPVLQALSREFRIRLRIICNPHSVPLDFGRMTMEHRVWRLATEVADLQELDIGLMPLPDDVWARGKCGLKALQYMACGVPCIVSPVGVNAEIVTSGLNGFTATSDEEWTRALRELIASAELRRRLGQAARQTVVDRYSASRWVPELAGVLSRVAAASGPDLLRNSSSA
jgi:hypothetical protein